MIFKKKYNKRNMETNIALERQEKKIYGSRIPVLICE